MPEQTQPTVWDRLAEPVPGDELRFFAGVTSRDKTRAMALAYVDARWVMQRLDDVLGPDGWRDSYRVIDAEKAVVECTLEIRGELAGEWIAKADVGYRNGRDDDEPIKSAYSDALKRAAVKWGIARELARLPRVWVAYDEQKKQFAEDPATKVLAPGARDERTPARDQSQRGGGQRSAPAAAKGGEAKGEKKSREKNVGDFLMWCHSEHKLNRDQALEILGVDEPKAVTEMGLDVAASKIKAWADARAATAGAPA